ncbi:RNA polymerase sigma factor, sigma-70 family [Singulisphaera sp. GP187]|uniref:sigma-70 family RNA polymerase sigma factor n=1 Tax=Singulisphaera sp. GP187 TaxID=1882752 RepID=UPI00092BA89C|nr:sigma-70 family RNA polymerase sigma factor [Singulisphaera sp. GP187]SIN87267.1 RNA polymerase sigma factor, sigma-70 family [Singulisphaera sp. GP187]
MARESANQVLRQIQTLYATGAVGGLTDAQLVERFLGRDGADREDAFAALVQRHGPMVLSVSRRMLAGSADVEDAFQAVFLVLARKAGAVRRVDGLKAWLYGVAVRTAKEARRRSARRRAREGGTLDESAALFAPDDQGRSDLLALLDEEIDRLPSRYREPVLLCELEGASRQDAARQLGVPEGTLSSRLSRGRSLLRDRLARRGVGLGTGLVATLISEPASASLPEPLAASTVRLALEFAATGATAGAVPMAVASLAEGVLGMIIMSKLKLILVAIALLGAATCLTAGLAVAVGPTQVGQPPDPKPAPPAAVAEANDKKTTPQPIQVRGVVVDEAGRPVAGAEVRALAFTDREARGVSGVDGSFAIPIRRPRVDGASLLARSVDGNRLGVFLFDHGLTKTAAEVPVQVVLKSSREITIRVTDLNNAPVPGATVEVAGSCVYDDAKTGPDGSALLHIPADATVGWVVAQKSGRGFDYAEYGPIDEAGRLRGGIPAADLPESVALTLDGAQTARIKAVDSGGKPLAGVDFYLWVLQKEGRRSHLNFASRIFTATTGPDGVADFDWLPRAQQPLNFWPIGDGYAHRRVIWEEGHEGPVIAKLSPIESIRGRVVHPDGSPAEGIEVHASGSGHGMDNGEDRTRTATDGSYWLRVNAGEVYAVYVDDKDWAAPSRLDVTVREGKPADGVDFTLTRGTVLRGTVTVGPDHRPAPNVAVGLDESGDPAPEELREKGDHFTHQVRRHIGIRTDSVGHYSFRVGPGTYTVLGPPRTGDEEITIKDEVELVRDFWMPRPEKGPLTGRVVLASAREKGVAGAKVEIVAAIRTNNPFSVTTDDEGRFHAERELDPLVICAKSSDGRLGAIVEAGADDSEVVLAVAPTATATGLLLDEGGKPAPKLELYWGRRVPLGAGASTLFMDCFAPKVVTDAEGRFTLPSLVVGQAYYISTLRGNVYPATGAVRPKAPGLIDLGTLQIGVYRPNTSEAARLNEDDQSPSR